MGNNKYTLDDFDYELPRDLIAQYPADERENSRLMVLNRNTKEIISDHFYNLLNYIDSSYCLVLNETEVIPARLLGKKPTGGNAEIFLLEQLSDKRWKCLVKPGRRLKKGNKVIFAGKKLVAEIEKHLPKGKRIVKFHYKGDFFSIINKIGHIPLPPYIDRADKAVDEKRYQTVFAKKKGSVAAPTAGLHFSDNMFEQLDKNGIQREKVNLRIGLDTFRPVKTKNIENHKIHSEFCSISKETAYDLNEARSSNKRILAVGTTSVRTLETFAEPGKLNWGSQKTDLFIYPGYKFLFVDALLTNFHLPKSSLIMLVSAFAGYDFLREAYRRAVKEKYRFFSYGDAMLIL